MKASSWKFDFRFIASKTYEIEINGGDFERRQAYLETEIFFNQDNWRATVSLLSGYCEYVASGSWGFRRWERENVGVGRFYLYISSPAVQEWWDTSGVGVRIYLSKAAMGFKVQVNFLVQSFSFTQSLMTSF